MNAENGSAGESPRAWAWILREPSFGCATPTGEPKRPSNGETLREVLLHVNVFEDVGCWMPLAETLFTLLTWIACVGFFGFWFSWAGLGIFVASIMLVGTVTNTVWLHRYCSHRAFAFRRPWMARAFCWLNGLAIAEDKYALAHFVHHQRSDKVGDPYGPHLGRLGSYFASLYFSKQLNRAMTPAQYERLTRTVRHIGTPLVSYQEFQRFGSTEHPAHQGARLLFAQVFWSGVAWLVAGVSGSLAWFAAIAVASLILRDFNYSGHGGARQRPKRPGWEFDDRTRALNHWFYGLLGSEWHNNHHTYPRSANLRLLRGQVDRAFWLIRLLHGVGIVSSYRDDMPRARERLAVARLGGV